jgi:hypothetical protein
VSEHDLRLVVDADLDPLEALLKSGRHRLAAQAAVAGEVAVSDG